MRIQKVSSEKTGSYVTEATTVLKSSLSIYLLKNLSLRSLQWRDEPQIIGNVNIVHSSLTRLAEIVDGFGRCVLQADLPHERPNSRFDYFAFRTLINFIGAC